MKKNNIVGPPHIGFLRTIPGKMLAKGEPKPITFEQRERILDGMEAAYWYNDKWNIINEDDLKRGVIPSNGYYPWHHVDLYWDTVEQEFISFLKRHTDGYTKIDNIIEDIRKSKKKEDQFLLHSQKIYKLDVMLVTSGPIYNPEPSRSRFIVTPLSNDVCIANIWDIQDKNPNWILRTNMVG